MQRFITSMNEDREGSNELEVLFCSINLGFIISKRIKLIMHFNYYILPFVENKHSKSQVENLSQSSRKVGFFT